MPRRATLAESQRVAGGRIYEASKQGKNLLGGQPGKGNWKEASGPRRS